MEQGNCRLGEGDCSPTGKLKRGMCSRHYQRWRAFQLSRGPRSEIGNRQQPLVDRTGLRVGRLLVTGPPETRLSNGKKRTYWLCRCDCGNEVTVWTWSLGRGDTRSCGCLKTHPPLAPGVAARNCVRKEYRLNARARGLCWELTEDDFDRLTSQPCFYCGLLPSMTRVSKSGGTFTYNGIDRMDNSLGYTPENTVSCCTTCNIAKRSMPFDAWIAWIARLTEYHFFHPDVMPSRLLRDARKSA